MHEEVLDRIKSLDIPAYRGFMQPRITATEENGEIVDVKVEPAGDFVEWMLESEKKYSFLPISN